MRNNKHSEPWIFIGCYTQPAYGGKGIYTCQFDASSGMLSIVSVFTEIKNPSFLTLSVNAKYLYAVIESDDFANNKSGGVAAFQINQQSGVLTLLNQHATGGADPCHITIDKNNNCLLLTNYTGGSVAVFKLNSDGSLGDRSQFIQYHGASINYDRQSGSHPHSAIISADNKFVFIPDLGVDYIRQYCLDAEQRLLTENNPTLIKTQPGAGPRHFIFHPNNQHAYVINELNNTIVVYDYAEQLGLLTEKQIISTLPINFKNESTAADIHITANGRFLYASNRGHDSLAIFSVDKNSGELTALGYQSTLGKQPRNFFITLDDRYLLCANQVSNNIVSFLIDAVTGQLTPTQQQAGIGQPVCIRM